MTKYYRIVFEEYDIKPSSEMQENIILEGELTAPALFLNPLQCLLSQNLGGSTAFWHPQ